jgi:hypothetical protein
MKVLRIRTATNNPEDNLPIILEVKVRAAKATAAAKKAARDAAAARARAAANLVANPVQADKLVAQAVRKAQ